MKKLIFLVFTFIATGSLCSAQSQKAVRDSSMIQQKVYTCSMHPEVTSNKPGKCPKCGMELIEKKQAAKSDSLGGKQIPPQHSDSSLRRKRVHMA